MNLLYSGIILLICALLILGIHIGFKPFKVSFDNLLGGAGIILIMLGVGIVVVDARVKGYIEGGEKATTETIKLLDKAIAEQKELNKELNKEK